MELFEHITVCEVDLVQTLNLQTGANAIDCTGGGGGHTAQILRAVTNSGRALAIDQDPAAISALEQRFADAVNSGDLSIVHGRFSGLRNIAKSAGLLGKVDGICADLGFSSPQIDNAARGFAFSQNGPLDMRMDPNGSYRTAADWVNEAEPAELEQIFREYGEEPKARAMAQAICQARSRKPLSTTRELADLAERTLRYKTISRTHPATRIFQALRIVVNDELGELQRLLDQALEVLKPGGRLAIISFHSLEDRLVKTCFRNWAEDPSAQLPRDIPITAAMLELRRQRLGHVIKPFPLMPSASEIAKNPRARSAKIRTFEKATTQESSG